VPWLVRVGRRASNEDSGARQAARELPAANLEAAWPACGPCDASSDGSTSRARRVAHPLAVWPRYGDAMSDAIKRAVESLAAAWAERDPARRADLLASAVTDDVRMVIGAGISQAVLYQRFGSKEEMVLRAITPDPPDLESLLAPTLRATRGRTSPGSENASPRMSTLSCRRCSTSSRTPTSGAPGSSSCPEGWPFIRW
jgi:hypothetical protein